MRGTTLGNQRPGRGYNSAATLALTDDALGIIGDLALLMLSCLSRGKRDMPCVTVFS